MDKRKGNFSRKFHRSLRKRLAPVTVRLRRLFDRWSCKLNQMDIYHFDLYQPLPWIGLNTRKRGESTFQRWELIKPLLPEPPGSALDLGCNLGFFVMKLAEAGHFAVGVDMMETGIAIAQHAQRRTGISQAAFTTFTATPDTIDRLPVVDTVIFFSVWHHWIRQCGHAEASRMLGVLWQHTRKVMFFESGEDSEITLLGITGDPGEWVAGELRRICSDAEIRVIGKTSRGTHKKDGERDRTLFAVLRQGR